LRYLVVIAMSCLPFAWATAADSGVTDWGACEASPLPPLDYPARQPDTGDELEIFSGKAEFRLDGDAKFTDRIILRYGEQTLSADDAEYDAENGTFVVNGAVEYRDPQARVLATNAQFDRMAERVAFESAEFRLKSVPARGSADSIRVSGTGTLSLRRVSYTSCPAGNDDWMLRASKIRVDQKTGIGTANNARLNFKGVPILYLPYISYPVTSERKTGWLIPNLGSSEQRGLDLVFPFYWNIAPARDATFTPRFMSQRGLQLQTEFRYLESAYSGTLTGEYLNDDSAGTDRSLVSWFHQNDLWGGWRATVDAINVSDSAYFEDLSGSLAETSQTHLERSLAFEFFNGPWAALFRVQDFQTIDDAIVAADKPYKRLPQLAVYGYQPRGLFGLKYRLTADANYFDRNEAVTGLRMRLMPEVGLPLNFRFFDLEPSVAVDHTRYNLNDIQPGQDDSPERTAPIYSIDLDTTFERLARNGRWLQTLEPRALYTYIPFRDQTMLPVFDTIEPDLNIVQLFRKNRFMGYDRLANANQLSLGVTTRLLNADDGRELMRATIGQVRYFDNLEVTLPGGQPSDDNSSDYLAEVGARLYEHWYTKLGYQWNSDRSETVKAEARLQYRPDEQRLASIAYRFRRDTLEEIDIAASWPFADHWNAIGRFEYSIEDNEPLERFVGLEYETCCWGLRAIWRRHLARRTGESDTSFSIQLVLKGFSSVGKSPAKLLDRGILGYD